MNNLISEYFFCYSPQMANFLRHDKGIEYICKAKHTKTNKEFCLFVRNEQLQKAIEQYKKRGNKIIN